MPILFAQYHHNLSRSNISSRRAPSRAFAHALKRARANIINRSGMYLTNGWVWRRPKGRDERKSCASAGYYYDYGRTMVCGGCKSCAYVLWMKRELSTWPVLIRPRAMQITPCLSKHNGDHWLPLFSTTMQLLTQLEKQSRISTETFARTEWTVNVWLSIDFLEKTFQLGITCLLGGHILET